MSETVERVKSDIQNNKLVSYVKSGTNAGYPNSVIEWIPIASLKYKRAFMHMNSYTVGSGVTFFQLGIGIADSSKNRITQGLSYVGLQSNGTVVKSSYISFEDIINKNPTAAYFFVYIDANGTGNSYSIDSSIEYQS